MGLARDEAIGGRLLGDFGERSAGLLSVAYRPRACRRFEV